MNPSPVPENAKAARPWAREQVIGKPPGYTDDEIGGLPSLIDTSDARFPTFRSYWRPEPHELEMLNAGGFIELGVVADQMVPVSMGVFPDACTFPVAHLCIGSPCTTCGCVQDAT